MRNKNQYRNCIELGTMQPFPGVNQPALFQINDLTTHALICGGTQESRTALAQKIAAETLRLRRNVLVISAVGGWAAALQQRKDVRIFNSPPREFALREAVGKTAGSCAVFELRGIGPREIDSFLEDVGRSIFGTIENETSKLELLLILDGVYDLIAPLSFKGPFEEIPLEHGLFRSPGILWLERGVRELRKFGRGIVLTSAMIGNINSETLSNIWTLIHMGGGPSEVKAAEVFFGEDSKKIMELEDGKALALSPNLNNGRPFIMKI
ncbi:MAG: hypothetical protein QXG10_03725 [Candidatus Hadarchaeales archaeon]